MAILYHQVSNPHLTIRNFLIAARGRHAAATGGASGRLAVGAAVASGEAAAGGTEDTENLRSRLGFRVSGFGGRSRGPPIPISTSVARAHMYT
jgi:hypothetical protein